MSSARPGPPATQSGASGAATMLAVVQHRYGPTSDLELATVERPVPGEGEVLVRVAAASVNPADWFMVTGRPFVLQLAMGRPAPKVAIRGTDVSGTVEAIGSGVTRFGVGDTVFGCGNGSFAEYLVTKHENLALVPAGTDLASAAALPMAATVALQALRDHAKLRPGQKVLVIGAAGGIGSFTVQIAKSMGAEVTGVCSTGSVELVRSLGADRVIDYSAHDFATDDVKYDVILDNAASHSLPALLGCLTPRGMLIPNNGTEGSRLLGSVGRLARGAVLNLFTRKTVRSFLSNVREADLVDLAAMLEAGTIRPVIDRTFPLDRAVAALDYIGEGHARGKVLVTI